MASDIEAIKALMERWTAQIDTAHMALEAVQQEMRETFVPACQHENRSIDRSVSTMGNEVYVCDDCGERFVTDEGMDPNAN